MPEKNASGAGGVMADWSDSFDKLEALLPKVADEGVGMAIRYAVVMGREAAFRRTELEAEVGALRGALRELLSNGETRKKESGA